MIVVRNNFVDKLLGPWEGSSFLPGIVFLKTTADDSMLSHEMKHQEQIWRYWVVGFWVLYLYQLKKYGYKLMPLEVEARKAE